MILVIILLTSCAYHLSSAKEQAGNISPQTISNSSFVKSFYNKTHADTQSESETNVTSTHPSVRLQTDDNSETLSNNSTVDIDALNDSSEVYDNSDTSQTLGSPGLDDLVLPKVFEESSSPLSHLGQLKATKNVFKVPKTKNKKTLRQPLKSLHGDPTIKDSSAEYSNITRNQNYFHSFTSLYDHFLWDTSSFAKVNNVCVEDINIYLKALKGHASWALKASDASGKYRGLFLFDNDYWLGKLI